MFTDVRVTAEQAALIYRDLRVVDRARRQAARRGHGVTFAADTALQAALALVEPYVAVGGVISGGLVRILSGLVREADGLALEALAADEPRDLEQLSTDLRIRHQVEAAFADGRVTDPIRLTGGIAAPTGFRTVDASPGRIPAPRPALDDLI
ncbi:hypothetical protein [Cellulomonas hominis]